MARWAPVRADVIGEYAAEVQDLFPAGRILVGLDCDDAVADLAFARDLAAAISARGVAAEAVELRDEAAFRTEVLVVAWPCGVSPVTTSTSAMGCVLTPPTASRPGRPSARSNRSRSYASVRAPQ